MSVQTTTPTFTVLDAATTNFCCMDDHLYYCVGADPWQAVTVNLLFPFSDPAGWMAVRDENGEQRGIIEALSALSAESQAAVRREIQAKRFLPTVRRILACRDVVGMCCWELETDHGHVTCTVRPSPQTLFEIAPGRYLLVDVNNNRYDVQHVHLDTKSRLLLARRI